ncbi:MAG TPA: hypothetical protein VF169_22145 [Albitalea sp.]|uniref:hypothetical protein n=1 Tax=Piscinibacter sp. TaxID=1903157 RepID=UPI002ED358EB
MTTPRLESVFAALAVAMLTTGCASTRLDAQWADPQRPSLRGTRVLVACEAREAVIKRICQDQVAAEVVARGATPVLLPDTAPSPDPDAYAQAARNANARAVLSQQITPYGSSVSPGMSIGLGGFSFGGGGGVGVGVSAPLGGGQVTTGYSANARLTDAQTGKVLWTAKASSPPSQEVQAQLLELTRAVFDSADKLGLF